jgi:hypothetical protein
MSQPNNRKLVTQQLKYRMRPNEESIRIMEEVDRDELNDSIANRNGIIVSSQHINSERQPPMNRSQDNFNRRSKLVASGLSTSVEDPQKRNEPYTNSKSATGHHAKGDYVHADKGLVLESQPFKRQSYYQNLMHSPLLNFS